MSYGPDLDDIFRLSANYVDRILKGANPGELPAQAPTKYELVINLKAAKGARSRRAAVAIGDCRRGDRMRSATSVVGTFQRHAETGRDDVRSRG